MTNLTESYHFATELILPGLADTAYFTGLSLDRHAAVFLLAVATQESGLNSRYDQLHQGMLGTRRGFWRLDAESQLRPLFTHETWGPRAARLCDRFLVQPTASAAWRACEGHDLLSLGLARLYLALEGGPIPDNIESGWKRYLRGKWISRDPDPVAWVRNWRAANTAVELATCDSAGEPYPFVCGD